jgi:hypothetical protein
MYRSVYALLATVPLLSGCVTRQGVVLYKVESPPAEPQRALPESGPPVQFVGEGAGVARTRLIAFPSGPSVVYVGHVSSIDILTDEEKLRRYQQKLKRAAKKGVGSIIPEDRYVATTGGASSVRLSGVKGIYAFHAFVDVPQDLVNEIRFASVLGSVAIGTTGDLVAGQGSDELGAWVTHVLCREQDEYFAACSKLFARGFFSPADGHEVDSKLERKKDGRQIDLETFREVR